MRKGLLGAGLLSLGLGGAAIETCGNPNMGREIKNETMATVVTNIRNGTGTETLALIYGGLMLMSLSATKEKQEKQP